MTIAPTQGYALLQIDALRMALGLVGAAILAGVGTGIYQNAEEGYKHLAIDERVIMPDPERSAEYRRLLPAYKRSVQALGDVYGL